MRNKANLKLGLVVVAALFVAGSSCSLTKGKETAEAAAAQFHNQYNAGLYREIYGGADDEFKKFTGEEEFVQMLEALRRKLGTVKRAELAGWNVNTTTAGTTVTLGYNVEFSEGNGTERFVFHLGGDKTRLYSYNVNSPLLITR